MAIHTGTQSGFIRHIGLYNDKKIAIVLQLPEEQDLVHVIDIEALHDSYHQNLMDIIVSQDTQNTRWLGEALHRKMFFDGTNALRTLYEKKLIHAVPVSRVIMTPKPNLRIPLSEVIDTIRGTTRDPLAEKQNPSEIRDQEFNSILLEEQKKLDQWNTTTTSQPTLHNQHAENLKGDVSENQRMMARNYVAQAEALEQDARRYRAQAMQLDPTITSVSISDTTSGIVVDPTRPFIDGLTGKAYATIADLKGAVTRREKKQQA